MGAEMSLTDEERGAMFAAWDLRAHVGAEHGPSVLVGIRGTFVRRLLPDEARALALKLWDTADEAEGFGESRTEPSPPSKGPESEGPSSG